MNRRAFLCQSLITAGIAALGRAGAQDAFVVVRTGSGMLRGKAADDVRVFRGVPFAQPPVGPLRFRPAQKAAPWTGTRDALRFAAAAIQSESGQTPESEDCLYLNVWAPASPGPHPVFVWIHGGGFTGGRSFDPVQDGATFARQGIVCITVAYRLGVFGFLDFGPILGGEYAGSANLGLSDLIMALTWVQGNVASFGGDPARVTVGGQSAGAKLTDLLMGTPAAAPLFQQMISESGGAERVWSADRAAEIAGSFAKAWGNGSGTPTARLKDAPASEILAAQKRLLEAPPVHFPLRPEIDGKLIPRAPLESIRAGATRNKRLLLGTTLDESAFFLGAHPEREAEARDLGNMPVAQFRSIEEQYKQLYPTMSADLRLIRSVTAEEYWIPSLRVADAHVGAGGKAFVYRFDYAAKTGRFAGEAVHAEELPFVWDHLSRSFISPAATALAATLHDAWCAFIRGEVPSAQTLPAWPPYSTPARSTMLLNAQSKVENAPHQQEFELWNGQLMR